MEKKDPEGYQWIKEELKQNRTMFYRKMEKGQEEREKND